MVKEAILGGIILFTIIGFFFGYIFGYDTSHANSEPTKICKDGKLYEVTHEGNITIFDRKAFMTCEDR